MKFLNLIARFAGLALIPYTCACNTLPKKKPQNYAEKPSGLQKQIRVDFHNGGSGELSFSVEKPPLSEPSKVTVFVSIYWSPLAGETWTAVYEFRNGIWVLLNKKLLYVS